ncbi:MAG: winged helix-turn-helix domain-containing protein [Candidatus Gastranaerophilaceae bacterium]
MLLKKSTEKKSGLDMQQEIINAAGQIYNYLAEKGEVSMSKMKKDLDLSGNFAEMGLGWLSREDKIMYTQKARSISISLR